MLLAEAAHSLKTHRTRELPKAGIAGSSERADQGAAAEGAHRDSNAFRQINDTFAALRNEGPHEGTLLKDEIAKALGLLNAETSMTILLVEQYLDFCKELADNFAILDRGSVVARGSWPSLTDEVVKEHLTV